MAMFPLQTVLFPGAALPLHVFEPRYRALTADCLAADRTFGVVLISRGREVGGGDERVGVGTAAVIEQASPFPDGRWALLARGTHRIVVETWLPDDPYPLAQVRTRRSTTNGLDVASLERATAAVRRARALLSELGSAPPLAFAMDPASTTTASAGPGTGRVPAADELEAATWELCQAAPLGALDRQRLLETDDAAQRLEMVAQLCDSLAEDLHRMLGTMGGSETMR